MYASKEAYLGKNIEYSNENEECLESYINGNKITQGVTYEE